MQCLTCKFKIQCNGWEDRNYTEEQMQKIIKGKCVQGCGLSDDVQTWEQAAEIINNALTWA